MQKHSISAIALTLSVLALFTRTVEAVDAQVTPPKPISTSTSGTPPQTASPKAPVSKVGSRPQPEQQKTNNDSKQNESGQNDPANQPPFTNNHYVLTGNFPTNGYHKGVPVVVIVDKSSHFTHVLQLQGDRIVRILTLSNNIGSLDTPTPPGRYTVVETKMYPKWIPPKDIDPKQKPVPPYNETHKNPLGVAAIYLNKFMIDLHGTNEPKLIRKSSSHGCVRHSNSDILKLFAVVHKGDVVYIVNRFRGKVLVRTDFVRTTKTHSNKNNRHATHRK